MLAQGSALGQAPIVETLPASEVTATSAVLRASVLAPSATSTVRFEWGTSTNYGNTLNAAGEVVGYGLDFDPGDRVTAGVASFSSVSSNFTMEVWARPTSGLIMVEEMATANISYFGTQPFAIAPDHAVEMGYPYGDVGTGIAIGTNGVMVVEHAHDILAPVLVYAAPVSGWTHVAVVYEGGTPKLYLNGMLARIGLASGRPAHPSLNLCRSAGYHDYGRYKGSLDELRLWGTALSGATVQSWMNTSITSAHSAYSQLLAEWSLNEGTGAQVGDASAYGRVGAFGGTPTWIQGATTAGRSFSGVLAGLIPGTTYHFRAILEETNTTAGLDVSFTTPSGPLPVVVTLPASSITQTSALLSATVSGPISTETVSFEWGTSTNYGNTASAQHGSASGGCLSLDGLNDQVLADVGRFPQSSNNFTLEFWANPAGSLTLTAEVASDNIYYYGPQRYAVFPDHGPLAGYPAGHVGAGISVGTNGVIVVEHSDALLAPVLVYTGSLSGWTHVALTYSEGQPRLYLNGTLARTGIAAGRFVHPSLNISGNTSGYSYGHYQGQIDDMRVWNQALNSASITAWMNTENISSHPASAALLAHWPLNEAEGTSVQDTTAHQINGTLQNGAFWSDGRSSSDLHTATISGLQPDTQYHFRSVITGNSQIGYGEDAVFTTLSTNPPPPVAVTLQPLAITTTSAVLRATSTPIDGSQQVVFQWGASTNYGYTIPASRGPAGYALEFNGSTDGVSAGSGQFPTVSNTFSMEFWAKAVGAVIFTKEAANGNITYEGAQPYAVMPDHGNWSGYPAGHVGTGVAVGTNGVIVVEHTSDTMASVLVYTGSLSGWTHIAVIYDQGQPSLYLDGVLVRTGIASGRVPHPSANLSAQHYGYGLFKGALDEFRVWRVALTPNDLRTWMTQSIGPSHPSFNDLMLAWTLESASGSLAIDSSSYRRNGEFMGIPTWISEAPAEAFFASVAGLTPESTYHYRAVASNEWGVSFGADVSFTTRVVRPVIKSTPSSVAILAGKSVSFSVQVEGAEPMSYQWVFNGTNIADATSSVLTIPNVQLSHAGLYSAIVTNAYGSAQGEISTLSVTLPPTVVRMGSVSAMAGQTIVIPVEIIANGNESALQFSVNYTPSILTFVGANLSSNFTSDATLFVNTAQTSNGRVGLVLGMPPQQTIAAGTRQIAELVFSSSVRTSPTMLPLGFGDSPTRRQLVNAQAETLRATYNSGLVTLSASVLEADVTPRPNGDRSITVADWVLMGRYAARLDYPTNTSEFQRADCAPRATLGDGRIGITDWVQAGRYAGGADPLTTIGGPLNEASRAIVTQPGFGSAERKLILSDGEWFTNRSGNVSVTLAADGTEVALGFSLVFDPARLEFESASKGSGAASASLNINTTQISEGRVGIALGLSSGTFQAGNRELVTLTFRGMPSENPGVTSLAFGDLPIPREIANGAAAPLASAYQNAQGTVRPIPTLTVMNDVGAVMVCWPSWATNMNLQGLGTVGASDWTNVTAEPKLEGDRYKVVIPGDGSGVFYRLIKP